ncbi:cysteinyl-tRNA synthetase [Medicago truncatula]|nr:cysteinyl-tRNA synthetase [Medicago truncatula]
MSDLLCERPTKEPRVSDHIDQIKDMITKIINNDFAYEVDGDVFYSVEKFPNYGALSGQRKRHPADFALWKAAKPGEPSWDSPWGPGRPGWHIECSAMSACYLSHKFDIHGGGIDLIFPHHENEIAQNRAADKESRIKYWLHNGHVTNNNEKMSKSLGNFFTVREITERYHPLALRHFLISAHYRAPLNYSIAQLETSSDAIYYIFQTLEDCRDALSSFLQEDSEKKDQINAAEKCINKLKEEFQTEMNDDLQTHVILKGALLEALKFMNRSLQFKQSLLKVEQEVREVLKVLGLLSSLSYAEVLQQLKDKALKRAGLTEKEVLKLIEERKQARINKDFAKSDNIRTDLTAKGIALEDVDNEMIWRPCIPSKPLVAQAVSTDNKVPEVEEKLSTLAVSQKVEEIPADREGKGSHASSST